MTGVRPLLIAVALVPLACSGDTLEADASPGGISADAGDASAQEGVDGGSPAVGGEAAVGDPDAGDEALIVPKGLSVMALAGGNGVLDVTALTLRKTEDATEIYAALRNNGEVSACSAAFSVELFDHDQQSLAAGIGGLLTQHFYRLTDGSDTIAACVGPGDVTMAALTDLPSDLTIEDVGYVVYRCPYFALDVVPIEGLTVDDVAKVTGDDGTAYAGTLVNRLRVTVSNPSVAVFPVNRVGRPLGMAGASATIEIPPGGEWAFETDTVDAAGVDSFAYAAGALGDSPGE